MKKITRATLCYIATREMARSIVRETPSTLLQCDIQGHARGNSTTPSMTLLGTHHNEAKLDACEQHIQCNLPYESEMLSGLDEAAIWQVYHGRRQTQFRYVLSLVLDISPQFALIECSSESLLLSVHRNKSSWKQRQC